ncbi:hypothetical protein Nepgr_026061 [Nepenthes gracilis]|uniref:Uncharacterized protein n=1 Tax=Nepenthes gracilis TaxID=150966 RepID=A0AAD3T7D5_NEPGR|nr:hypothetical protein Nepgr_026061 [Nepenthes gracilis]
MWRLGWMRRGGSPRTKSRSAKNRFLVGGGETSQLHAVEGEDNGAGHRRVGTSHGVTQVAERKGRQLTVGMLI